MTRSIVLRRLVTLCAVAALLGAGSSQAASISYDLTLSNDDVTHVPNGTGNIPNGTPYARVTIDDEGAAGLINFTVTILDSVLTANKDNNFGLQSFGFNVVEPEETVGLVTADIINLPNVDWTAFVEFTPPNSQGTAQDGFGKFDAVVSDGGQGRVDPSLTFSIDLGLNQTATDDIFDYIAGSNDEGHFFAAHITGFTDLNPLLEDEGCVIDSEGNATPECNILTSVWVAGSTVIPVPAAAWLFGSALGILGWVRRRTS